MAVPLKLKMDTITIRQDLVEEGLAVPVLLRGKEVHIQHSEDLKVKTLDSADPDNWEGSAGVPWEKDATWCDLEERAGYNLKIEISQSSQGHEKQVGFAIAIDWEWIKMFP